jgi:hypothetical protein
MPNTYTELQRTVVGTAASSVNFSLSGISGYTDLRMVISGTTTVTGYSFTLGVNGDTGSNYSQTLISGNGSSAQSAKYANASNTSMYLGGWVNGFSTTDPNVITVDFMNYSNTTTYKTILWRSGVASRNTEAGVIQWRGTTGSATQAITSITIYAQSGSNIAVGTTFSLYGIANANQGAAKATGGIITEDATYWYHTFGATSTFIPKQALTAEILTIAGGGSGGLQYAGGGGAGGLVYSSSASLVSGTTYTCTVGAGAAKAVDSGTRDGSNGSNSTFAGSGFSTITATGGGLGGGDNGNVPRSGGNGGSGGGGSATSNGMGSGGTGSQGFNGAAGVLSTVFYGGGGGGAGEAGNTDGLSFGGDGTSTYSSWGLATGTGQNVSGTYWYAGGGGGSANVATAPEGGLGGGGAGGKVTGGQSDGIAGTTNTGGGGGAGWGGMNNSGAGGSGIVIVRYAK